MDATVLILDDDAGVLELTALYLKSRGFSTITCDSAACALEKVREAGGRIGILIADVTLPDSSGVEAALELKKIAPDLKILFVSGYSFEDLSGPDSALYHLLPPSSVRFLRKPYSAQDLIARIMELSSDPPATSATPAAVFEALERQAGLLDMVHDAIVARTLAGEIRYWNRGAELLYGWTKQEAIGKSIGDLLHTVFPEPFAKISDRLRAAGYWEGELQHRTSAGNTVTVLSRWGLRAPNLRSAAKRDIEILEINRDLTTEKQARSDLLRTEERFRAFWEAAPGAMMLVDRVGRIVRANSRTERDFGYTSSELEGAHVGMLLPELARGDRRSRLSAVRKNGERLNVEVTATPLPNGERVLIVSNVRTDSNPAMDLLPRNTRQELRSPLHTLIGFADLLASEELGPLNGDQARFVRNILSDSWHLLELVDEGIQPRSGVSSVLSAVNEVVSSLQSNVKAKSISIAISVRGSHLFRTDPAQFRQLLYNLVNDAIRFTPEDGEVRIDCLRRGEFIEIAVSDGAPEISEEMRRVVVEQLGGEIRAESGRGRRGSVILSFPAAMPQSRTIAP